MIFPLRKISLFSYSIAFGVMQYSLLRVFSTIYHSSNLQKTCSQNTMGQLKGPTPSSLGARFLKYPGTDLGFQKSAHLFFGTVEFSKSPKNLVQQLAISNLVFVPVSHVTLPLGDNVENQYKPMIAASAPVLAMRERPFT